MSVADVSTTGMRDWSRVSLTDLVNHIESIHHAFLRRVLPRLSDLMAALVEEPSKQPELLRCRDLVASLRLELDAHTAKEEQVLFPMIREIERSATLPEFPCGSLGNPIRVMEHEHDGALHVLSELRERTHQYTPPEGASDVHRESFSALAELEADLLRHIHKENEILFPRTIAAESSAVNRV